MSKAVKGFLTSTGVFYESRDAADYHEYTYELRTKLMDYADAFEVPKENQDKLAAFFLQFIKSEGQLITALYECFQRLNPSDEVAGQPDEGREGLREPVRSGDTDRVESTADAKDTSEQPEAENADTNEVQLLGSRPDEAEAVTTDVVVDDNGKHF